MENDMNVWAHGWSRLPNGIAEALNGCAKKAQVMGVYLWIVSKASKIDFNGKVPLKRGQLRLCLATASAELGLTEMQLRGAVETLITAHVITRTTTRMAGRMTSILTICDYERYNGMTSPSEHADNTGNNTDENTRCNTGLNLNKEIIKKETKKEEKKEEDFITVADLPDFLIAQRDWADWFCASYGMDRETLRQHMATFAFQLQTRGEMRKSASDALKHFSNWFQVRCSREAAAAQEAESHRQAALEREAEEKRRREAEASRKAREAETKKHAFLDEIFAKADAGDTFAMEVIRKHGLVRATGN